MTIFPKTKGEITIDEVPPLIDFDHFTLNSNELITEIGVITSIVYNLVIVQSIRNSKPLDEDTILFTQDRHTIGKIYETFGPVCQPYYSVRVNLNNDSSCKYLVNTNVYYVPNSQELTKHIFNIEKLKSIKGSDASWSNDQEPPVEYLDYSDDEEEKLNKQRLKAAKQQPIQESSKKLKPDQEQPRNHSFRQPYQFMQPLARPPQLLNQSFQQMMSPQIYAQQYNMMMMQHQSQQYYMQQQQQQQQFIPRPSYYFNNSNEIKKSF
jgi:H/ACA ribonucleoprotein complex non-core subunit NAF1